jgi:LacI family gluconate utilization system Gnt-I transcriptional repressor
MTSGSEGGGEKPNRRIQRSSAKLADVARLAGVSPVTASRAINSPNLVSGKRVQMVLDAVEQLGYVPNGIAGSLHTRRSRLIAAVVPTIRTSMFAETVEAFSGRLRAEGYEVLLGLAGFDADLEHEERLVAAVLSRKPDAILLTGIDHTRRTRRLLMNAAIPIVETWELTPTPIDMVIGFSHEDVGRAVARYFLSSGRTRPAVFAAVDKRAQKRRNGFLREYQDVGIPVLSSDTCAPGTLRSGREALRSVFERKQVPDSVFCSSDPIAEGVLIEAKLLGIDIPAAMSLVGFGDFTFSSDLEPPLSTIHLDRNRLGTSAAEAILAEIDGTGLASRVIDLGFELLIRGTS